MDPVFPYAHIVAGILILIVGFLFHWLGQLISIVNWDLAVRLGLQEKDAPPEYRVYEHGIARVNPLQVATAGRVLSTRLVLRDSDRVLRFNADIVNARALEARLDEIVGDYGDKLQKSRQSLLELHEKVFHHNKFTGRSGTMFGFEGLGSIYWHMVAKLMLAAEEVFFEAGDDGVDETTRRSIGHLYYRIRDGIGFNKSPLEYGAFPTDPYSHTPAHAGARQPGMTGQVKEEVLCRFAELGVRVTDGLVSFDPSLLRRREFAPASGLFEYLDIGGDWKEITVPEAALAFTWCQVPILYTLVDSGRPGVVIHRSDGSTQSSDGLQLSIADSAALMQRNGEIRQLTVSFAPTLLLTD